MQTDMKLMNFLSGYCQHYCCSEKRFHNHLLWNCFTWPFPLSVLGRLIATINPGILKPDYIAIDQIGRTCNISEFLYELDSLRYLRHRDGNFFPRKFRFGLSIAKLKKIGLFVFAE